MRDVATFGDINSCGIKWRHVRICPATIMTTALNLKLLFIKTNYNFFSNLDAYDSHLLCLGIISYIKSCAAGLPLFLKRCSHCISTKQNGGFEEFVSTNSYDLALNEQNFVSQTRIENSFITYYYVI